MGVYTLVACADKVKFINKKVANDSIVRGDKKKNRSSYKCKACGFWHVGSIAISNNSLKLYKAKKRELSEEKYLQE